MMTAKFSKGVWGDMARLKNNPNENSAIAFVEDRESRRKKSEALESAAYLKHVKDVKSRVPHKAMTLESFLKLSPSEIPECIAGALRGLRGLDAYVISKMASDLGAFPAARALIRANMYRTWIYIEKETSPARDKVDDGRQIIDASYSDFFVTADGDQIKLASMLNPELSVVSWQKFKN